MLPRTPHAEDHSYSLLQERSVASRTYGAPLHSLVTIGSPSSSTLSEKGLGDEATCAIASGQISARRRGSARLPGTYPCLESREPDRFRLRMGATLEIHVCSWSHPFFARGGFQATRKTQLAIALPAHTR